MDTEVNFWEYEANKSQIIPYISNALLSNEHLRLSSGKGGFSFRAGTESSISASFGWFSYPGGKRYTGLVPRTWPLADDLELCVS